MKYTTFPGLVLITAVSFAIVIGCAHLQPGADPLVVRTEQAETTAVAAFDFVVNTDNANRGFWITNAPPFHAFAEWLRTPVGVDTNGVPQRRALQMVANVDGLKLSYEANHGFSNNLATAVSVLVTTVNQATSWQTIITTKTQ